MTSFWQELIKLLGGFAIFASALAWLIERLVAHLLTKDVEAYKSRLTSESAQEIEKLKAQLQVTAADHNVRFSKLHEKRAEIISKLYELLNDATSRTQMLDNMLQNRTRYHTKYDTSVKSDAVLNEFARITVSRCEELYDFFSKHKLYFSKNLSDKMEHLISVTWEPSAAYDFIGAPSELNKDEWSALTIRWNKERTNIKDILELMEKEFRVMLGSESWES